MRVNKGRLGLKSIAKLIAFFSCLVFYTHAYSFEPYARHPGLNLPGALPNSGWDMSENAFGTLKLYNPTGMAFAPGDSNHLYVLEKHGRVRLVNMRTNTKSTFIDLTSITNQVGEGGLLGIAFHPDYQNNGTFFLFYTLNASNGTGTGFHTRLSKFQRESTSPPSASKSSEVVLISQFNERRNHNGGDIHFGPDGYLYVSLGDEGGARDSLQNSQKLMKDFFSAILRIDVDQKEENLEPNPHPGSYGHYKIPKDNPFINVTRFDDRFIDPLKVRTEFWAVGLRNPWRIGFDPLTGKLFAGDVGQEKREEINVIVKGGNYGWSYREGTIKHPGIINKIGYLEPIWDYPHGSGSMQGNSVIGGIVYRGHKFSELFGKYIFGDYLSGNIWILEAKGYQHRVSPKRITGGVSRISSFCQNPYTGDILGTRVNLDQSEIRKLTRKSTPQNQKLPQKLSDTGIFTSLKPTTPAEGVIEYKINHSFWSDTAKKTRWIVLPPGNLTVHYKNSISNGKIPVGTTFVKHFEIQLNEADPDSLRKLETRIIRKTDSHVYGATYKWDKDQLDATLVPEEGAEEILEIVKGGKITPRVWTYPSRSACLHCHSKASGGVLGFEPSQLNRDILSNQQKIYNQVDALVLGNILTSEKPKTAYKKLVSLDDPKGSIKEKALSYLHVNCAPCHQPGGPAIGNWDARISTSLWKKKLLFGDIIREESEDELFVIHPGKPEKSAIISRTKIRGPRQMPPIGSHLVDQKAVDILEQWIKSDLKDIVQPSLSWEEWYLVHFKRQTSGFTEAHLDSDNDGTEDFLEYLLSTDPTNSYEGWRYGLEKTSEGLFLKFNPIPKRGLTVTIQKSSSLSGPWENLKVTPKNNSYWSLELSTSDGINNFFRIILREP